MKTTKKSARVLFTLLLAGALAVAAAPGPQPADPAGTGKVYFDDVRLRR